MFELSFDPAKETRAISDSMRIINACRNTNDAALALAFEQCKSGDRSLVIRKKFIDARHGQLKLNYRFDFLDEETLMAEKDDINMRPFPYLEDFECTDGEFQRPVVIGFGPAGMFAALTLAKYGLKPIVIERGADVDQRAQICKDFKSGNSPINSSSNIQFGEGGAGTFSDGKLYTGINSALKAFIADVFVLHGAPAEIMYDSKPHIGTDNLVKVVKGIRKDIEELGGTVMFDTLFTGFKTTGNKIHAITVEDRYGAREIKTDKVVLAPGHSGRDTFSALYRMGIKMEPKPFAVGVRIEHLRSEIDRAQYGVDTAQVPGIGAADYKLAVDTSTGKKLYTFCMCPGGEVIAAQSSPKAICTNGMSYHARDMENSNSALLVPVDTTDFGTGVMDGITFQETLENTAFLVGGGAGYAPVTRYGDLMQNKISGGFTKVKPSFKPGVRPSDFSKIFPPKILATIKEGITLMGDKIDGFDSPDAVLTAVEARSSSPVRIIRDAVSFESVNLSGLFPAGEGAGYAGGIMSSAVDGINTANALVYSLMHNQFGG